MATSVTGRTLASASRLAILRLLRERGEPMPLAEIAQGTHLHPNTAREHLDRLVMAGFVARTAESSGQRGRPRHRFALVPRRAAATADPWFRMAFLAGVGAAGAVDGPEGRQLAALELHLTDLGFDPEPDPADSLVHLRRCPYANLARAETALMCEVHLDLAWDVLAAEGGPLTAERLDPFVGPEHCLLHLGRAEGAGLAGAPREGRGPA